MGSLVFATSISLSLTLALALSISPSHSHHPPSPLQVVRKLHGLLAVRQNEAEPVSQEAKRRLAFFVNSLFMEMPSAPKVEDMRSFTVVTPFYSEVRRRGRRGQLGCDKKTRRA